MKLNIEIVVDAITKAMQPHGGLTIGQYRSIRQELRAIKWEDLGRVHLDPDHWEKELERLEQDAAPEGPFSGNDAA